MGQAYWCRESHVDHHGACHALAVCALWHEASPRMMTGHDTGRSQNWGCVEMLARHAAHDAMAGPHRMPLAGGTLTVNDARPRAWRRAPRSLRWSITPRLSPPVSWPTAPGAAGGSPGAQTGGGRDAG